MTRSQRKMDHINYALSTGQGNDTWFDDIRFVHQALPDLGLNDIDLRPETGDLNLKSPVFINAMTGGGGEQTEKMNALFARVARETGMAMAVGSQMSAIKDPSERKSFSVVRKENPSGIIFANLGSEASVAQAQEAVEILEANALQIHLNVVQELTMPEGDRDFKGALDRIGLISESLPVPVIVKETGFGISYETAMKLAGTAVSAIDVSGYGGTNFAKIENERRAKKLEYFHGWGVPTAAAIVETRGAFSGTVLASGGIKDAQDMVKAFLLGADAAGLAGSFLKLAVKEGESALVESVNELHDDLVMMMTALGAASIRDLRNCPALISGNLANYLIARGFDPATFARPMKN